MLCIDWNDNDPILLLGSELDNEYTRLELIFNPCNYIHT